MGRGAKESRGRDCPGSSRPHTPIMSKAEQGLMGSELARRRAGEESRMPEITTEELRSHLHESAGKKLPKRVK